MLDTSGLKKEVTLDQEKVNNGVWVHLVGPLDPLTGERPLLYLKDDASKPQRALVRSHRCKLIRDAEEKHQKSSLVKIRLAKRKERDGVIAESGILKDSERFGYFLAALENFGAAGGIQTLEPAQAAWLFDQEEYADIVDQIRETAYDDTPYLAGAGTPEGNGSPSSPKTRSETTGTEIENPA